MTQLLLKLFVKDYSETEKPAVRDAYGTLGSFTGICCNLVLFVIKLILGIISGSVSIMADAFNNLSDIGSSVVTLLGFKMSKKPADPDHPFGHGRMEYMSAFVVAMLIIMVGVELFKSSFQKILNPEPLSVSVVTFAGLFVSIGIKLWMNFFNRKLGKAIGSASLNATAQDSLNDCISTTAVLIAIVVFKIFSINLDAYMGVAVAVFIVVSGINTARETLSPLLGEPPSHEMIEAIEEEILKNEQFSGIHDLIIHNYGPGRCFASVHVEVPEDINIIVCHELIDKCECDLKEKLKIDVVIHMDPIAVNDSRVYETKKSVLEKVHEINPKMSIHDFRMVEGENRTNLIFDVAIPADFKIKESDLIAQIDGLVKSIDKKYCCVINVDLDFTGK